MRNIVITYLTVLVVFTAIDFLWLGFVALDFYKRELGPLMLDKPRLEIAALFYALIAAGITILAVQPALNAGEWHKAVLLGAVLGLCAYGTYDLTNLATIRNWPLPMVIVDMVWGAVLSAVSAAGGVLLLKQFGWA